MNPTIRLLFATSLLAAATALVASPAMAAEKKAPSSNLPPPPGMNDPGVVTPQAVPAAAAEAAATSTNDDPLAPPPKPDARLVRDKASRDGSANAQRIASSQVTTRKQGTDTVEEYRDHGHVWMIKIVPQNGLTQTFMDSDGSGRLARDPHAGPISPVYYTLYEWK
ncbi:MAG: DUF2782 domain-containing protein [Dokdonella sp.]